MNPQTPDINSTPVQPPAAPAVPPAAAAPAPEAPLVPETWPGAFGVYKNSRAVIKKNLGILIVIWLLAGVSKMVISKILGDVQVGQLIVDLISIFLGLAIYHTYLAGTDGQKLDFGQPFSKALNPALYAKFLVVSLVSGLATIVGFLLLIVPGIIILPRLILAPYYLIDRKLGIGEALSTTWNESKGYSGKIWGIIGVYILMALMMITVIGIPFAIYLLFMYSASLAVLYRFIGKNHPAAAAPASSAPVSSPASSPATPPATPASPASPTDGSGASPTSPAA